MNDKTIPYKDIIMRMDHPQPQTVVLPEGYYLDAFKPGDEETWADMEYFAGDFVTRELALGYFKYEYMSRPEELQKRFIIVRNSKGEGVCSCVAWNTYREDQRCPALTWLVTAEGYEGLGLADAVAAETVNRFIELGEDHVYLHTQPWSYKAVWLYYKHGFRISKGDSFQGFANRSLEALPILDKILKEDKKCVLTDLVD